MVLLGTNVASKVIFAVGGRPGVDSAEVVSTDPLTNCSAITVPNYPTRFGRGVAAFVGGRPIFCLGENNVKSCHSYDFANSSWIQVHD